jgi:Cu-Zn family superoxide dismutase
MARWQQRPIRFAAPLMAVAAFGLVACSPGEEASDVQGTTPPIFTGSPNPSASAEGGEGGGSGESLVGELDSPSGQSVGSVTFTDEGDHLQVSVQAENLTPGFHGFHIHQVGVCEPNSVAPTGGAPGDFLSSGGHLQVGGRTEHPASGDLTSLQVREDGTAELTTTTDAVTLDDLRKGVSVIVHAGPDNFANIPTRYTLPDGAPVPDETTLMTGDAGGRVACAVLK